MASLQLERPKYIAPRLSASLSKYLVSQLMAVGHVSLESTAFRDFFFGVDASGALSPGKVLF